MISPSRAVVALSSAAVWEGGSGNDASCPSSAGAKGLIQS